MEVLVLISEAPLFSRPRRKTPLLMSSMSTDCPQVCASSHHHHRHPLPLYLLTSPNTTLCFCALRKTQHASGNLCATATRKQKTNFALETTVHKLSPPPSLMTLKRRFNLCEVRSSFSFLTQMWTKAGSRAGQCVIVYVSNDEKFGHFLLDTDLTACHTADTPPPQPVRSIKVQIETVCRICRQSGNKTNL